MSNYTKLLLAVLCLAVLLMACGADNKITSRPENPWSDIPEVPNHQTELTVVGAYDTPGPAMGVFIEGNFCYVADNTAGLLILDISNPMSPELLGQFQITGANRVSVYNNFAYLSETGSGLPIIDVTDPTNPQLAGVYSTPIARDGDFAHDVYFFPAANGVQSINISTPTDPQPIGQVNTLATPWDLTIRQDYAYVAQGMAGIGIINIANPVFMNVTGELSLPGHAFELCLDDEGNMAFVAAGDSGLQVVNVVDSHRPFLAGHFTMTSPIYGIATEGSHVFLAADNLGIVVLDVSKPSLPQMVNSFQDNSRTRGICVQDNYIYVADVNKGLLILKFKQ